MRKTRTELLLDLIRAEEEDARVEQMEFPLNDPHRAREPLTPAAARARAKSLWVLEVSDVLVDVVVFLSELADDETKLCRCLNAASCLCVGSNKFRVVRREARILERRAREHLAMRTTTQDATPVEKPALRSAG